MFVASRSNASRLGTWHLFAWFGQLCDQAAGVLLSPLVVIVYARSVQSDLVKLSWIFTAFGLAWLLGASLTPLLQHLTVRAMPWIVGGYIVRTASVCLLAYSASDRGSPADQRFRSALICLTAYAAATGIARSAEARHLQSKPKFRLLAVDSGMAAVGLAAIVGMGAWVAWSVLSVAEMSWSIAFGRVWSLCAIALGVATLAAIRLGVDAIDIPRYSERDRIQPATVRSGNYLAIGAVSLGLSAITFLEAVAFLGVFADFRRQSIIVRSSLALFVVGWAIGILAVWLMARRYASAILVQISIGLTAIALVAALSLRDVAASDWFPSSILDQDPVTSVVYVMAGFIGTAAVARRTAFIDVLTHATDLNRGGTFLVGVAATMVPTGLATFGKRTSFDWLLIAGIVIALLTLALSGMMESSGSIRRPGRSQKLLRTAALSRH